MTESKMYAVLVRTKKERPARKYEMLWYNDMFLEIYKDNENLEYISHRETSWEEYIRYGLMSPVLDEPSKTKLKLEDSPVWKQGELF